jgi:hypothetical protein
MPGFLPEHCFFIAERIAMIKISYGAKSIANRNPRHCKMPGGLRFRNAEHHELAFFFVLTPAHTQTEAITLAPAGHAPRGLK